MQPTTTLVSIPNTPGNSARISRMYLWGVVGRVGGSVADFKYSELVLAAAATGVVWDQAALATYVANPSPWLQTVTDDAAAMWRLGFKLTTGGEDMATLKQG